MATNPWVSSGGFRPEQNLYEDLVIESLKFYGQDVYYLPRELVNVDKVFMDDVPSHFSDAYKIEMYVENVDGFGGEGDLFSKFGVELRDQATFVTARRRWKSLIGDKLDSYNFRPREGDVIYIPFSKSMFEIFKVETETPFYQLNQLPTFRLQCELFEYNDEDFDVGIDEIDDIELEGAYQYKLNMASAVNANATASSLIDDNGRVYGLTLENRGIGYNTAPTVTIASPPGNNKKFGTGSLDVTKGRGVEASYTQTHVNGSVEAWVYINTLPASGTQAIFFETGGSGQDDKTYFWGVGSTGQLVYSRGNNNGGGIDTLTNNDILFQAGTWHHILIGASGTNNLVIYFDFVKKYDANVAGVTWNWVSANGFSVGADAARTVDGVDWNALQGFVDEYRVRVGTKAQIIETRYDSAGTTNLATQTAAWTSDSATAYLNNFDPIGATGSSVLDSSGTVNSILQIEQGLYYDVAPVVTIASPYTGGQYKRGEIVTQTNSSYTIKGEVVAWSDSDNTLYLAHVGATDGKLHTFSKTQQVIGASAAYAPTLVSELMEINVSPTLGGTTQNNFFDDFESDFLDFSEGNPFGDME